MSVKEPRLTMSMFVTKEALYKERGDRLKEIADELLEALEGLYNTVEQGAAFIGNPDRPCEKARAAIRKAKGEQQ